MFTTRLFPLLAISTVLGLTACSQGNSPEQAGSTGGAPTAAGGAPETGGTPAAGGSTAVVSGGALASGGTSTNGGTLALGGTTTNGGAPAAGGIAAKGGSVAATGGVSDGTGGTAGGPGGAAGAPAPGSIPTGYPAPTADNYAKCKTVPVGGADNACAGQPAGNVCIECLFGGTSYNTSETSPTAEATSEAGNYLVTVTLGGAAAGDTYVSAESTRGMLQSVTTAAGQSLEYAFVVNAREMEGQPKHAGGPGGYPGLDLFFSGKSPQVSAIGYALASAATKPIMVYIASDSTTCDQTGGAFGGWGQMLPEFFGPPVGISNYANSGASSGGYPFWSDISSRWTKGDWIIIQFGHNDKTDTDAQVEANLTPHVKAAIAAGVNPIMVSPPARATSFPIGDQSSLHAAAAKAIATANNIPYIDLTALSTAWYNTLGSKATMMTFHANGTDQTHTNLPGAEKLAGLVAKAIKDQNIGLAQYLR
jgi:lysophospholipase L1-like esterase